MRQLLKCIAIKVHAPSLCPLAVRRLGVCTSGIYTNAASQATLLGMSRPPVSRSVEPYVAVSWLTMMKTAARKTTSKDALRAAFSLLLLASLAILVGCQGFSAGGTGIKNSSSAAGTLASNLTSLSFGNVTVGKSQTLSATVTNSGASSVAVSQITISGTGFSLSGMTAPVTLAAGQSATFSATFAPTTAGSANGNVTVTSNASNTSMAIGVSGVGTTAVAQLGVSSTSLSFGSVTVGKNQSLSETITNNGGSSATISQVGITGTGFTLSGISTPVTLAAGQSTTFGVEFAPSSAASDSGSVTITSDASAPTLTVSLSGSGTTVVGQLGVSPSTLALGSVVDGTSGPASGSLTATGANVTVTAATTNNSVFSLGGLSLPVTIAAGQSLPFTITFSPQTAGAASATLTVTSNASPTTSTEALTGTGTAAPTHTVSLSWDASTSSSVSGYNVYRAVYTNSCGSYSKINSVLTTTTLYSDSTVVDGASYCYAATAVNSSNEESGYSNIVSNIQIPPA